MSPDTLSSVSQEVDLLASAGVPLGAVREAPRRLPDREALRRAVFEVARQLSPDELVPIAAWLSGWEHHWPTSFVDTFRTEGIELLARLRAGVPDANRYLKLRRIAIENLAHVL